ncbi:hypothetical protein ASG92_26210 [Arthrobacter sp. Soil736]|uniref:MFS transporter n=1 Tax=Arthrobacter sp. Soil736 TaxID=1736395 RepID=UPI0006F9512A|nr:MFS transporter [Arthrobacter sp. Soil736]KRE50920.1 hypothetical protein ASG92_26210 [Arthrobacter sp. Soil736]
MSQSNEALVTDVLPDRLTLDQAIDRMPKVGLNKGAWTALFLAFFFANYEISVFALSIPGMRTSLGLQAANFAWPVTWNLVGYCVGAYIFGYIADRHGRQRGLLLTFLALGLGGLLTGFVWDEFSLSLFRFIAGCGMGAVLALCSAYIGEMAPRNRRGHYLARVYLWGGVLLLFVGLASLPLLSALPAMGWRLILAFGGLALLIAPFINNRSLTESPRWLAEHGQFEKASAIVRQMEINAGLNPTPATAPFLEEVSEPTDTDDESPLRSLMRKPYLKRLLVVLSYWFIFYIALYGYSSYLPLLLEGIGITTSNALLITVLTRITPLIAGFIVVLLIERMERRTLIIAGTIIFAVSVALIVSGWGETAATTGAVLSGFGIAVMATPAYTYTAEIFPTKSRGTAASICDGLGHLGGAVAPFVILPILINLGAVSAGVAIIAFLIISAGLIRMGVRTKGRSLEDIA